MNTIASGFYTAPSKRGPSLSSTLQCSITAGTGFPAAGEHCLRSLVHIHLRKSSAIVFVGSTRLCGWGHTKWLKTPDCAKQDGRRAGIQITFLHSLERYSTLMLLISSHAQTHS